MKFTYMYFFHEYTSNHVSPANLIEFFFGIGLLYIEFGVNALKKTESSIFYINQYKIKLV